MISMETGLLQNHGLSVEFVCGVGSLLDPSCNGEAQRCELPHLPQETAEPVWIMDLQLPVNMVQVHHTVASLKAEEMQKQERLHDGSGPTSKCEERKMSFNCCCFRILFFFTKRTLILDICHVWFTAAVFPTWSPTVDLLVQIECLETSPQTPPVHTLSEVPAAHQRSTEKIWIRTGPSAGLQRCGWSPQPKVRIQKNRQSRKCEETVQVFGHTRPGTLCASCRTQTTLLTTSDRFLPINGPDFSPGFPWQRLSKCVFMPSKE